MIDRFHVMQATNKELDKIRRRVKMTERGSKFIILRNRADLTESQASKLEGYLERSKRLEKAYELKEELRAIYESPLTVEVGRLHLEDWLQRAQTIYSEATKTIGNHGDEQNTQNTNDRQPKPNSFLPSQALVNKQITGL